MEINDKELSDFFLFLLSKTYQRVNTYFDRVILSQAFLETLEDVRYHYPSVNEPAVWERIIANNNELAIWLYRTGRNFWKLNNNEPILNKIHWLLKELCACEIYFSSSIDKGFYIFHGEGLVIGSRNTIGKGLRVYQNVTIGHKVMNSTGVKIGDDVRLYAGSKVLGAISIGSNVIVGANTVLTKNIENDKIVYGNPNIIKDMDNSNLI